MPAPRNIIPVRLDLEMCGEKGRTPRGWPHLPAPPNRIPCRRRIRLTRTPLIENEPEQLAAFHCLGIHHSLYGLLLPTSDVAHRRRSDGRNCAPDPGTHAQA